MLQHLFKITLRNLCKQTGRSIISMKKHYIYIMRYSWTFMF